MLGWLTLDGHVCLLFRHFHTIMCQVGHIETVRIVSVATSRDLDVDLYAINNPNTGNYINFDMTLNTTSADICIEILM